MNFDFEAGGLEMRSSFFRFIEHMDANVSIENAKR